MRKAMRKAERKAMRKAMRAEFPQDAAIHSHVLHETAALALVRRDAVVYVEPIPPANVRRRRRPMPDATGDGGYAHTGARRKAGLNTSLHDGRMGPLPLTACCHASMRRTASGSGPACVYHTGR
jgi:hypothetical protein